MKRRRIGFLDDDETQQGGPSVGSIVQLNDTPPEPDDDARASLIKALKTIRDAVNLALAAATKL